MQILQWQLKISNIKLKDMPKITPKGALIISNVLYILATQVLDLTCTLDTFE
jgi:hypothetical protein